MTVHPWVAQALAVQEGPITASTAVHTSAAARALARIIAYNRRKADDHPALPAGGLRMEQQHQATLLPHGVFDTPSARLFVFSDRSALVARNGRLVPFVWRIGTTPPKAAGMKEGTVLVCTFGDRSSRPAIVLANSDKPKERTWAIAVPHDTQRFSVSYPAYAQEVSQQLMDHVDRIADLVDSAPALALDPLHVPEGAWLAPFQVIPQIIERTTCEKAMGAFAAALHLHGATRGAMFSARVLLDGTLDWQGTWATRRGTSGNEVDKALTRKVIGTLETSLRVHGFDPMAFVRQSESRGQKLEGTMLLETDARKPDSRHLELALHHALMS